MKKDRLPSTITPEKLRKLETPAAVLSVRKRNLITMKDIVPSPKRNLKLSLTLKSSRAVKSSSKNRRTTTENSQLPSFIFDFLDEQRPQLAKPMRNPINIFKPSTSTSSKRKNFTHIKSSNEEFHFFKPEIQTSENQILRIRQGRKHSLDSKKLYKPYIIEITPRSSVTLYGTDPITLTTPISFSNSRKTRRFSTNPNIRNIAGEKKIRENTIQPVVISYPSKTFAEKLQRVQEIAKEAHESFYSLY